LKEQFVDLLAAKLKASASSQPSKTFLAKRHNRDIA
jgi:hypothetical protein